MLLVHKIALNPNNKQITYFKKASGIARFSYNWALAEWQRQYQTGEKPNEAKLRRELNEIKKQKFPWMGEVTKVAPQQAIKNLGNAFKRFFKQEGKYPKFKKKGIHDAFRADNGPTQKGDNAVKIKDKKIKLPKIGWVNLFESLRFEGQIKSVVISRSANRWYAAISVETHPLPIKSKNHATVGVDLGIKTYAQLSSGKSYEGAKPHLRKLKQLKRLSRKLSKKQKRSKNFVKAKNRLAKCHATIKHIRQDAIHKITTDIVLNYNKIVIEDLNVQGMIKNRKLSRSIMDQSFYEFKRQLEYKSKWYQSELLVADRFFPSSKMCHVCDTLNHDLTLSDREWMCHLCNTTHDRDFNAAINLEHYEIKRNKYKKDTASSAEIHACGVEGSGIVLTNNVKPCHDEARIQH